MDNDVNDVQCLNAGKYFPFFICHLRTQTAQTAAFASSSPAAVWPLPLPWPPRPFIPSPRSPPPPPLAFGSSGSSRCGAHPLLMRVQRWTLAMIFTCGEVRARRSTCPFCPSFLPSFFLRKGSKKHIGARQRLQQGLLRPLSSSESFEAIWRPFGGQRSLNKGRKHNRGLLAACLNLLKLNKTAPHAYLLLPCSPQVLQGHCPLVK